MFGLDIFWKSILAMPNCFFNCFTFVSSQKLLVYIILYRLFECCVCWWITLCSLSSLITCFSFNCKKKCTQNIWNKLFPFNLDNFLFVFTIWCPRYKVHRKIFSLKLFVLLNRTLQNKHPKKNFLTNLIKSHFLAVNEIQRQNTVPSRSNSDMNYPHFYITFLFTFLIDVSSVSYIIHHIHYIFIICFYYTMKSCRSWHSYTQILHHIILLFFGFWIPSYLQFLYILINGIHALFINLIEERMLRLFSTFFTSALGLKHFHLFWSSFP